MQFGFGSGVLYATRNDIANGTPIRFGALQDVSVDFSGELKELYGQNQYALDAARGKVKIQGKAKYAQISASIMTNMFFGGSSTVGTNVTVYNEADTISAVVTAATSASTTSGATLTFASVPAGVTVGASVADATATGAIAAGTTVASKTSTTVVLSQAVVSTVASGDSIHFGPYVSVANQSTFAGDLGIYYASTGVAFTYVAGSAPLQGQYTEVNGVYSFNTADANTAVLANYLYTNSMTGFTFLGGNPLMGTTPKFQATFNQQYGNNQTTLILYSCVASKLTFPTKIDDYVIQEFDFMAYANAAGSTFSLSTST
jgi:hypothetical protein